MARRRSPRFPVEFTLDFIAHQDTMGVGTASNLSTEGCTVEGNLIVHEGWILELRLLLPGHASGLKVERAEVRWSEGQKFGLEFLRMGDKERERLYRFISTLKSRPSPLSKSKGKGPTERRRAARFPVQFTLSFLGQHVVGVGSASNLSTEGCTVESELMVHQGWPLELRLRLPDDDLPLEVIQAEVRWSQGQKFGLEFVRIQPAALARLRRFVSGLEAGLSH